MAGVVFLLAGHVGANAYSILQMRVDSLKEEGYIQIPGHRDRSIIRTDIWKHLLSLKRQARAAFKRLNGRPADDDETRDLLLFTNQAKCGKDDLIVLKKQLHSEISTKIARTLGIKKPIFVAKQSALYNQLMQGVHPLTVMHNLNYTTPQNMMQAVDRLPDADHLKSLIQDNLLKKGRRTGDESLQELAHSNTKGKKTKAQFKPAAKKPKNSPKSGYTLAELASGKHLR